MLGLIAAPGATAAPSSNAVADASATKLIGATAQPFQLLDESGLTNVHVAWGEATSGQRFTIERSADDGATWQTVTDHAIGESYDDYGLKGNATYVYRVTGTDGTAVTSNAAATLDAIPDTTYSVKKNLSKETYPASAEAQQATDSAVLLSNLQEVASEPESAAVAASDDRSCSAGFGQSHVGDDKLKWIDFTETCKAADGTSTTRVLFTGDPAQKGQSNYSRFLHDVKLESGGNYTNPQGQKVYIRHWERTQGYSASEVLFIVGTPGKDDWHLYQPVRPQGNESRDMTLFQDGGDAYIIGGSFGNATQNLYKLKPDWSGFVDEQEFPAVHIGEFKHREAPSVIHEGDWYYLLNSGTAGWYPTQTQYIAAHSTLEFGKGTLHNIGDNQNYGTQSGGNNKYGNGYTTVGNRWAASWDRPEGYSNREVPLQLNGAFASKAWYPMLRIANDKSVAIPVQFGRNLSQGQPIYADGTTPSVAGQDASYANDGLDQDGSAKYTPADGSDEYTWAVDLGVEAKIGEVDLAFPETKEVEAFARYTIEGSTNGKDWTVIADARDNQVPSFQGKIIHDEGQYRYVRVHVYGTYIARTKEGDDQLTKARFQRGLVEVNVYGTPVKSVADVAGLKSLVDSVSGDHALKESDYTAASWKAFADALAAAQAQLNIEIPAVADVDRAAENLKAAKDGLVRIADLAAAVADAETVTKDGYTDASWTAFADALANAKAVLAKSDATADDVSQALQRLTDARKGLVAAQPPTTPDRNDGDNGTSDQNEVDQNNATSQPNGSRSDETLASTGATAGIVIAAMALAAGAGCVLLRVIRRD